MNAYNYDFNQRINRRNTNSIKYDFALERKGRDDLLPLWVADMDFALPEEIVKEIRSSIELGIFGYSDPKEAYYEALATWFETKFGWRIKQDWNTITPGVVYAIATAIRAFTKENDAVLIQQPVYYPFQESIVSNKRTCINNELVYEDGKYHINFDDFEKKIIENQVKLFILCSPHNPVGRVWTKEELTKMGEICLKHHVIVIADEIHCDFTYSNHNHIPFASIKEEFAENVIVCTSPSKTFNMAGLQVANIMIPNELLRRRFRQVNHATGYSQGNSIGITAATAAYKKGAVWQQEVKQYIEENVNYVQRVLQERIPEIKLVEPEGTYLIWLDCSALGLDTDELEDLIVNDAKLWLDSGSMFGEASNQFQRINVACPRSVIEQAMKQLEEAVILRRERGMKETNSYKIG